ncbi:MAG: asparagine synthase (glutamine-hydrolyzing) [Planctomycetaceae bacterium]|nr:asparagine synthase (glutamine-hydrolyzing) [Planctomycetaceae bacterium]
MCGIAGCCWTPVGSVFSDSSLQRMLATIEHRGPDDSGTYFSQREEGRAGAALGHRRLSIIDLGGGHQPLANEDDTVWIAFNGEIYNYKELRGPLEAQGHQFRTSSDTETIVHLYEQYGVDCVDHLRGMFAFAIWDGRNNRLFLARDRLGQKPLFYCQQGDQFFFASEMKAILQAPGVSRELNHQALDHYLAYQYVPHPMTMLRGIHKLPPGHFAVVENGQLNIERYWLPPFDEAITRELLDDRVDRASMIPQPLQSADEWKKQLRETLTESVRLRMRSDVPLGTFLSGGIDSTIIAGLSQSLSTRPIHTFSIGFPVKQFDETSYAREAAAFLGTDHHEEVVTPSALETLPSLIWHYDEPFADSSAIPTMYLSQMTRRDVTVALSGDGGDELFAGYERYQAVRLGNYFDRLPRPLRSVIAAKIWQRVIPTSIHQKSFTRRLRRLLEALSESPEHRYSKWIWYFDDARRRELYSPEFIDSLSDREPMHFLEDAYSQCRSRDFVTRTTCADVLTYLPCDILTKVDIASMAFSLECRSPFLDHRVAELAARMPIELKQKGRTGKQILIDTFADLLPPSIQQRSKMGFGVPLNYWFRDELKGLLQDTLLDDHSLGRGYFDPAHVRRLVNDHIEGRWDHSSRLWALLCFELWHWMYLDSSTPPTQPSSLF